MSLYDIITGGGGPTIIAGSDDPRIPKYNKQRIASESPVDPASGKDLAALDFNRFEDSHRVKELTMELITLNAKKSKADNPESKTRTPEGNTALIFDEIKAIIGPKAAGKILTDVIAYNQGPNQTWEPQRRVNDFFERKGTDKFYQTLKAAGNNPSRGTSSGSVDIKSSGRITNSIAGGAFGSGSLRQVTNG